MKTVVAPSFRSPLGYEMQSSEVTVTLALTDVAALVDYRSSLRKTAKALLLTKTTRVGGKVVRSEDLLDRVEARIQILKRLISRCKAGKGEISYYTTTFPEQFGESEESVLRIAFAVRIKSVKCGETMKSYRILRSNSFKSHTFTQLTIG